MSSANDWMREMDAMLAGFSGQATLSLQNIRRNFEAAGRSFTEDFKKYFFRVSLERYSYPSIGMR